MDIVAGEVQKKANSCIKITLLSIELSGLFQKEIIMRIMRLNLNSLMDINKITRAIIILFFLYSCGTRKENTSQSGNVSTVVISGIPVSTDHPRLFIDQDFNKNIERKIEQDSSLMYLHDRIITVADSMVLVEPLTRVMNGRRLLLVSRKFLKRSLYLAYAYHTTGDKKYLDRAEEEMLQVSSFKDWNPSHFLDVAEMTTGMGIAYDWLYDDLPIESRNIIREAIITKGINPSFDPRYNDWLNVKNNWNQVCNTGMTIGALSILEDEPKLAEKVLNRTIKSIEIPMEVYKPDGVYPEGPMYWVYGTTFNVMLYDLLLSVFDNDFGIIRDEILQSAYYFMHATGPTGDYFNYSDSSTSRSIGPAFYWFADYMDAPEILSNENAALENYMKNPGKNSPHNASQRLLPFALIWAGPQLDKTVPKENTFFGRSEVPVAMYRSGWNDPNALYLGIKGGSPGVNHGHMDIGSFVLDADGIRWALDPGTESYSTLEAAGLDIWKRDQESDRWKVFRYKNSAHNTLTIDGRNQNVDGHAEIKKLDGQAMSASIDLTELYKESVQFVSRKFEIKNKEQIQITDSIVNTEDVSTVRWSMVTRATPVISDSRTLLLQQDNEEIELKILSPANTEWKIFMENPQPAPYDSPNPNIKIIGMEKTIGAGSSATLSVLISTK